MKSHNLSIQVNYGEVSAADLFNVFRERQLVNVLTTNEFVKGMVITKIESKPASYGRLVADVTLTELTPIRPPIYADGTEIKVGDAVIWSHYPRHRRDVLCVKDEHNIEISGLNYTYVPSSELTPIRPPIYVDGTEIKVGDAVVWCDNGRLSDREVLCILDTYPRIKISSPVDLYVDASELNPIRKPVQALLVHLAAQEILRSGTCEQKLEVLKMLPKAAWS